MRVTVSGADRVARRLDAIGRELTEMKLTAEAQAVARTAAAEAPKRTGALSRDIEVKTRRGIIGVELGRLDYGPPVHQGSKVRNIRPNKFIHRAARRRRRDVVNMVARRVSAIIRRRR